MGTSNFFSIHFENKRKIFIFFYFTPYEFVPTKYEKMHFFINFFNFMEKVHFFTFSRYKLIWGKIKKNEYFSFLLKVNRKKVKCAHPRAQKMFFED